MLVGCPISRDVVVFRHASWFSETDQGRNQGLNAHENVQIISRALSNRKDSMKVSVLCFFQSKEFDVFRPRCVARAGPHLNPSLISAQATTQIDLAQRNAA